MGPALDLTSVPTWAAHSTRPDADVSGRFWTVISFGPSADEVVAAWCGQIAAHRPDARPRVHRVHGDEQARDALDADLADAKVGWRLMIAGPAVNCLRLRAHAVGHDVADDEITVASTDVATRDVQCVHCRTVTSAVVEVEGVLRCAGCGRKLLVYYHVSRRQGAHLGFMVDAEQSPAEAAS